MIVQWLDSILDADVSITDVDFVQIHFIMVSMTSDTNLEQLSNGQNGNPQLEQSVYIWTG